MDKILSIKKASEILGVTIKTLKIWDEENKLNSYMRTAGNHRRYRLSDIENFINNNSKHENTKSKKVFIYCRVSTKKQDLAGNLKRQKERLIEYCKEKDYDIISVFVETASGINDKRKELIKMFKRLAEVNAIVIEYNDRLARFGFNYLKEYAASQNIEIEEVEKLDDKSINNEMIEDLVSIMTSFSARIYGARGGRKVKKTLDSLEKERKEIQDEGNG